MGNIRPTDIESGLAPTPSDGVSSQSETSVTSAEGYGGALAINDDGYINSILSLMPSPLTFGVINALAGALSVRCMPVSNKEKLIMTPVIIGVMAWACQDSSRAVIVIPALLFNCGRLSFG